MIDKAEAMLVPLRVAPSTVFSTLAPCPRRPGPGDRVEPSFVPDRHPAAKGDGEGAHGLFEVFRLIIIFMILFKYYRFFIFIKFFIKILINSIF